MFAHSLQNIEICTSLSLLSSSVFRLVSMQVCSCMYRKVVSASSRSGLLPSLAAHGLVFARLVSSTNSLLSRLERSCEQSAAKLHSPARPPPPVLGHLQQPVAFASELPTTPQMILHHRWVCLLKYTPSAPRTIIACSRAAQVARSADFRCVSYWLTRFEVPRDWPTTLF